jgi:putative ABC transport system ATP-binding protein
MIKLEDVCKSYYVGGEEIKSVNGVNLTINKGDFVGVLGSSGSGKSTLMYLIGLLERPTSGRIYIDGKDVSALDDEELSKVRNTTVGFVFQSFNLINHLSVLENVLLPTKYFKGKLDFDPTQRANDLLKRFGIFERKDFFPNRISGGQQQRVAIARALIMRPKILLADEPTGNLDSKSGEEIIKLISDLNKEFNITVVVVTHELSIAKRAKRHIYIKDGRLTEKYL